MVTIHSKKDFRDIMYLYRLQEAIKHLAYLEEATPLEAVAGYRTSLWMEIHKVKKQLEYLEELVNNY